MVEVDASTIRRAFNEAGIWEKVLQGSYRIAFAPIRERKNSPPGGPSIEQFPFSQELWIADAQGAFVAKAHRFLRNFSEEQLERRPDPKRIVIGQQMMVLRPTATLAEGDEG